MQGSSSELNKFYSSIMSKVSIIHYLVHVDLLDLFLYLIPVFSLLALMRANSHLNRHLVENKKTKRQTKKKINISFMINILILISMISYMAKHEFPQKEYFYKSSISKKQIRIDQENFLLTEFNR